MLLYVPETGIPITISYGGWEPQSNGMLGAREGDDVHTFNTGKQCSKCFHLVEHRAEALNLEEQRLPNHAHYPCPAQPQ